MSAAFQDYNCCDDLVSIIAKAASLHRKRNVAEMRGK